MASAPLVPSPSTALSTTVNQYIRAARAESTRRAYQGDVQRFLDWGGTIPTSPDVLAVYLSEHGQSHKAATLARWKVAIGKAHTALRLEDPGKSELVTTVLQGIRRTHGAAQRQVQAAVKADLLAMVQAMGERLKDSRDRTLLLLGFAGAFRRSEIVGLDVEDLMFQPEGLLVTIRHSKTDQEQAGRKVAIPYARGPHCPVKSLKAWLQASAITTGPVFRGVNRHGQLQAGRLSDHSIALVVKERAAAAGLDGRKFSGHSLRSGLATSAAAQGIASHKIRQQTGHRGEAMLNRYIRDGELFTGNAAGIL